MEPKGRGRGYGRARPGTSQGVPQQRPGPPQPQPGGSRAPPPAPPAWVRPPQLQQPPHAWPRPQMEQQIPQKIMGRGARPKEILRSTEQVVSGQGDVGNQGPNKGEAGNTVRGGRVSNRSNMILYTKPKSLTSKQGTSGKKIRLTSNYLPLIQAAKWGLQQYRVDMAPDVDSTVKRRSLLRTAVRDIIRGGYLFDGTMLFTPARITPDPMQLFVLNEESNENIRITIRLTGDVVWGDFHYIQLFNIIIRKCLYLMGLQQVGRHYFIPDNRVRVSDDIQLWPGFFTSMRQHERNIMLNVELQFKVLKTQTVLDMLLECKGGNIRKEFSSNVIGSVVLTRYNNKTYRVDDVDFNSTPKSTFKLSDGRELSYVDYFKQKYNAIITNLEQPMLVSRSKLREIRAGMPETVYLVPELCNLTGLTDQQRENFQLMRALGDYTRVGAQDRIAKLYEFVRKIHGKPEVVEEIRRWDLNFSDKLVEFEGRVLAAESIVGGRGATYGADTRNMEWTRELRSKQMFHAPKMERLGVICPVRFKRQCQDFVQLLQKASDGMRWALGNPRIFDIPDDKTATYLDHIERIINQSNPTLLMVVLSTNSQDRYSAIKKKCYVDRAIPTQMIVSRNLSAKGAMSIATKVAIQMNCKIGGAPWSIAVPLNKLMVVGYDVCRDTANKRKSFAGIVASMDRNLTRYFNACYEHQMEEELSTNFAAFMVIACKKFKQENETYPDRIIIYRDGVGEGQLPYVHDQEVANIKRKLKEEIYRETELKLAFVVVSKRINTRIFASDANPPPGTVVDDVITMPERYDFYLVSQCVRQGTVAPTSYNVIEDTMGLSADRMQSLAYKMTHMYYNWSGTVRVPAPCQYAHKLAFLVSQNLHRPAHRELENILYYL